MTQFYFYTIYILLRTLIFVLFFLVLNTLLSFCTEVLVYHYNGLHVNWCTGVLVHWCTGVIEWWGHGIQNYVVLVSCCTCVLVLWLDDVQV